MLVGGDAELVEEMSEDTDSNSEDDDGIDMTVVVICVTDVTSEVTVKDVDCVFVVAARTVVEVTVADVVVAGTSEDDELLDCVDSDATVCVDTAVVASVTVRVLPSPPSPRPSPSLPSFPKRPPTPSNKPPTTPCLGGGV